MSTKECPSCGAEVPNVVQRCKHCFHDFTEEPPPKKNNLVKLLAFMTLLVGLGALTIAYVFHNASQAQIVIDAESQDIIITRTSGSGTDTQRVPFDTVAKIEHITGGDRAMFEVVAVTKSGERHLIGQSEDSQQQGHAEHIAAVVGVSVERIQNLRGFGD